MLNCYKNIAKILLITALCLLVSSCGRNNAPMCVLADDFGDLLKQRAVVPSDPKSASVTFTWSNMSNSWYDTGVDVLPSKALQIKTSSTVNICGNNSVAETLNLSSNSTWLDTGITIDPATNFNVIINSYRKSAVTSAPTFLLTNESEPDKLAFPDNLTYLQAPDNSDNQLPIMAYIGNNPPSAFPSEYKYNPQLNDPVIFKLESDIMFDSPEWYATKTSGRLYLRAIADNNSWNGVTKAALYNLTIKSNKRCLGKNGKFAVAYIGSSQPTNINFTDPKFINLNNFADTGLFNGYGPRNGGRLYIKIIDSTNFVWPSGNTTTINGDGNYANNEGSYIFDITTEKTVQNNFGSLANQILDPVRTLMRGDPESNTMGLTEMMYKNITNNGSFVRAIQALMVLSVALTALLFTAGILNITHQELINISIKLGIILTVISPTSWEFFYKHLFTIFIEGTDNLIGLMSAQFSTVIEGMEKTTGNNSTINDTFRFLNVTLSKFFTIETNSKLMGLMNSFPFGFIFAILIYLSMFYFVFAVGRAFLIYLTSIIMTSLLLALAPIFLSFLLFNKTKNLFENWYKQLVSFMLQPVLIFSILCIFNAIIYTSFYHLMHFSVCWGCTWELDLPFDELFNIPENFDRFCLIEGYEPWGSDGRQGLDNKLGTMPVNLFMIFIFFILVNALVKFIDWATEVSAQLGAGVTAVSANNVATKVFQDTIATAKTGLSQTKAWASRVDAVTGHKASNLAKGVARKAIGLVPTASAQKSLNDGLGKDNRSWWSKNEVTKKDIEKQKRKERRDERRNNAKGKKFISEQSKENQTGAAGKALQSSSATSSGASGSRNVGSTTTSNLAGNGFGVIKSGMDAKSGVSSDGIDGNDLKGGNGVSTAIRGGLVASGLLGGSDIKSAGAIVAKGNALGDKDAKFTSSAADKTKQQGDAKNIGVENGNQDKASGAEKSDSQNIGSQKPPLPPRQSIKKLGSSPDKLDKKEDKSQNIDKDKAASAIAKSLKEGSEKEGEMKKEGDKNQSSAGSRGSNPPPLPPKPANLQVSALKFGSPTPPPIPVKPANLQVSALRSDLSSENKDKIGGNIDNPPSDINRNAVNPAANLAQKGKAAEKPAKNKVENKDGEDIGLQIPQILPEAGSNPVKREGIGVPKNQAIEEQAAPVENPEKSGHPEKSGEPQQREEDVDIVQKSGKSQINYEQDGQKDLSSPIITPNQGVLPPKKPNNGGEE